MNITDFDELTPEQYDAKRKVEQKKVIDNEPKYSMKDMIDFANYVIAKYFKTAFVIKAGQSIIDSWERAHKKGA